MGRKDVLESLSNNTVLGRFFSAGVVGALFENGVLFILVQLAQLSPLFGAIMAKELAILVVFSINDRWTFAETAGTDDPFWLRLAKSHAVRLVGVATALGVLQLLVTYTGLWFIAANVIGIGVGFAVNYVLESLLTWETYKGN